MCIQYLTKRSHVFFYLNGYIFSNDTICLLYKNTNATKFWNDDHTRSANLILRYSLRVYIRAIALAVVIFHMIDLYILLLTQV